MTASEVFGGVRPVCFTPWTRNNAARVHGVAESVRGSLVPAYGVTDAHHTAVENLTKHSTTPVWPKTLAKPW
jgi:hypothetical protein